MHQIHLFIVPIISGLTLTASCSRSLTDIGYQGSEVSTIDPSSSGYARVMNQGNSFIKWGNPHDNNAWYYLGSNPSKDYTANGRTIIIAEPAKAGTSTKVQRKNQSFLQIFYVDLYNDFRLDKFSKKYLKYCSSDVKRILNENKQDSTIAKVFGGWQVFVPATESRPNNCSIKYDGEDWYSIVPNNSPDSQISVKVIRENNKPLITAIK